MNCYPILYFNSLDRQGNNVLNEVVDSGTLYALSTNDGPQVQSWLLNPVPKIYEFPIDGLFDLLFVGNVADNVTFNPPAPNLLTGNIQAINSKTSPSSYNEVDRVYIGRLNNFKSEPKYKDTIHVLPQTGKVTIIVKDLYSDPTRFKGAIVIDNVARGIDLNGNLLESAIQIRKEGFIVNKQLNISAISFPSYVGNKGASEPLTISTLIFNKESGTIMASAKKVLTERLTPNKHIMIEYEFKDGNLVEFDMIIKDWLENDFDSGEAQ